MDCVPLPVLTFGGNAPLCYVLSRVVRSSCEDYMRRRDFITLLGGLAACGARAAGDSGGAINLTIQPSLLAVADAVSE
jgi:hypothetical protein